MNLTKELLLKYNIQGPRYTSYPPATFFHDAFTASDYQNAIIESNNQDPSNISLYIHIPFCHKLCHFCGCHSIALNNQEKQIDDYIKALIKEIVNVSNFISKDRKVTQIHWGGGTPHSITETKIAEIMNVIHNQFTVATDAEIAMECNPAYTDMNFFALLKTIGFNRISLGIQDFNPEVLKKVNRDSPKISIKEIVSFLQNNNIGVNLDLIYGLPGQTVQDFFYSLEQSSEIKPDRIVTFSYAHVPWMKKSQKYLEKFEIPDPTEKFMMLLKAYDFFVSKNYIPIGMDHFALANDELSVALLNKKLHRNFQGYSTKDRTGQVYAFGVSGISQLSHVYAQNTKDTTQYIADISKNGLSIERGYLLTPDEIIIRDVITEVMCNNYLNLKTIASLHNVTSEHIKKIIRFNPDNFIELIEDGLITLNNEELTVSELGRFFIRNVAMMLDPKHESTENRYSKTV
ncbi:MAG: oxygen-independent coproporphyrinogen III oxidase [Bacteroidales bacterium]|nr:oxygen-independent coproporphyrinogen III oxidase [Bacteroidales bacterium]